MDNSNLDNNRMPVNIMEIDHTLLDIGLVPESDEAGINFDGFQIMVEIDPLTRRVLNVMPTLFRKPPYGPDRLDSTDGRSPLT